MKIEYKDNKYCIELERDENVNVFKRGGEWDQRWNYRTIELTLNEWQYLKRVIERDVAALKDRINKNIPMLVDSSEEVLMKEIIKFGEKVLDQIEGNIGKNDEIQRKP